MQHHHLSNNMDSSNTSYSSSTPVCSSDNDNIATSINSNNFLPWPSSASSINIDSATIISCVGISAAVFAIFHLIRRYGPYIFTEAKGPYHRATEKESDRLLTRIHNKWYNLTKFDHPGGPIALSLIHQRDGTALFESHHPFMSRTMLIKILSKYEISKERETELGCQLLDPRDDGYYTWENNIENDKFVSDLKALVNNYFADIAKQRGVTLNEAAKATPQRWMLILSLMSTFFGTLPYYIGGNWVFLFATPILAWVTSVNYWHDGLHFALSTDWRINAWLPYLFPYYSSPWMWYHEHVIGHHAYPNIGHKDPDLAHSPQLMREHDSIKWKETHVGQTRWHRILFVWSVALGIGLSLLNDIKANLKLSYNNVVGFSSLSRPRIIAHILGRMGYVFLLHVWPYLRFPLWKAFIWATLPGIMLSVCFMINTQVNHLTIICADASSTNFYKHQVVTAQNFGNGSLFCYYFSGGLNYQIEHHLFPSVNHCHLPGLSKGVKRICEKHGVPYHHAAGYRDALRRHISHTLEMETKPYG